MPALDGAARKIVAKPTLSRRERNNASKSEPKASQQGRVQKRVSWKAGGRADRRSSQGGSASQSANAGTTQQQRLLEHLQALPSVERPFAAEEAELDRRGLGGMTWDSNYDLINVDGERGVSPLSQPQQRGSRDSTPRARIHSQEPASARSNVSVGSDFRRTRTEELAEAEMSDFNMMDNVSRPPSSERSRSRGPGSRESTPRVPSNSLRHDVQGGSNRSGPVDNRAYGSPPPQSHRPFGSPPRSYGYYVPQSQRGSPTPGNNSSDRRGVSGSESGQGSGSDNSSVDDIGQSFSKMGIDNRRRREQALAFFDEDGGSSPLLGDVV